MAMHWLRGMKFWSSPRPLPQPAAPQSDPWGRKPAEIVPVTQWAEIHRTEKFVCAEPLSGYRRALREDDGHAIYVPPDADDSALGQALLDALARSRFIWPSHEPSFFEAKRYMQADRNWRKDFMQRYGYKTRRDAYRNMSWCRARRTEGTISIEPHRRERPGCWGYLPSDRTVVIPETTEAAVAGAALRLALDRCE